jgi:D-alanyl-D-alanine dipeptidase
MGHHGYPPPRIPLSHFEESLKVTKRPWSSFAGITSQSFVQPLIPQAMNVAPADLVDMARYRLSERKACKSDPIRICLAYAQDELSYGEDGKPVTITDRAAYLALPRERRLNKFGLAYRRDAKFYLNKTLADIITGAAIHLHQTQGWTTVLYDGLRTMEGAYNLYVFASDTDMSSGLLTLPGQSAHNKGLAVDSMMTDKSGNEVEMGGHFDHLDMVTNSRIYKGPLLSTTVQKNRLIRETAFMHSALQQGLLIAPLRTEFWDDRLPENREDLWRVLDSAARCIGIDLLTAEDEALRKTDRAAWSKKWESWNYADFLSHWQKTFMGRERLLQEKFGVVLPPPKEKPEFYHGNYNPIYDSTLRESGKNLTEGPVAV